MDRYDDMAFSIKIIKIELSSWKTRINLTALTRYHPTFMKFSAFYSKRKAFEHIKLKNCCHQ